MAFGFVPNITAYLHEDEGVRPCIIVVPGGGYCVVSPSEGESGPLDYMSLEKHVTLDTPPCFLWQTVDDETVPVENSELFAKACKKQNAPFAYHVFSKEKHGSSLADKTWTTFQFGEPYTMAQTFGIIEAIKNGTLPVPEEAKEMLLSQFEFTDENREVLHGEVLPEVAMWPELAKQWLEIYL